MHLIKSANLLCSNIPAAPVHAVYISQLILYSRVCGSYHEFLDRGLLLTRKLSNQGFIVEVITLTVLWSPSWIGLPLRSVCIIYNHRYVPFVVIIIRFFCSFLTYHQVCNKCNRMDVLVRFVLFMLYNYKWGSCCSCCIITCLHTYLVPYYDASTISTQRWCLTVLTLICLGMGFMFIYVICIYLHKLMSNTMSMSDDVRIV